MCDRIIQFCTGSTKPLLFAGGVLSLLLSIAISYTGCTTHALYNDIDPQVASARSLGYFLQLAAAAYLTLITIFSCYAAYYDQKHSIRALAFITTLNCVLALVAILMVPSGNELSQIFDATLKQAKDKYNFTDKEPVVQRFSLTNIGTDSSEAVAMNLTRQARWAAEVATKPDKVVADMNATTATRMWDRLQARGCCGRVNGTTEWESKVPKSCCSAPVDEDKNIICKAIDADHQQGCLSLIASTSLNLIIVLSLIALVNFYLAVITGISAYRTFHYDEASQSAYT